MSLPASSESSDFSSSDDVDVFSETETDPSTDVSLDSELFLETSSTSTPSPTRSPVFQEIRPPTPVWTVALMQAILPSREFELIPMATENIVAFDGIEDKPQVFKTPAKEGVNSGIFFFYPRSQTLFMLNKGLHDLTEELEEMKRTLEAEKSEILSEMEKCEILGLKRRMEDDSIDEERIIKRGRFEDDYD